MAGSRTIPGYSLVFPSVLRENSILMGACCVVMTARTRSFRIKFTIERNTFLCIGIPSDSLVVPVILIHQRILLMGVHRIMMFTALRVEQSVHRLSGRRGIPPDAFIFPVIIFHQILTFVCV